MNYLDFIKNKKRINESCQILLEGFKEEDFTKALKLINNLFKKEIPDKYVINGGWQDVKIGSDNCISRSYIIVNKDKKLDGQFFINWLKSGNSQVPYSVSFFDKDQAAEYNFKNGKGKANLNIDMLGASIVYYIPVIAYVVNNGKYNISDKDAVKLGRKVFDKTNECIKWPFYIGAQEYTVYEGLSDKRANDMFRLSQGQFQTKNENGEVVWENELEDAKRDAWEKVKQARKEGDPDEGKYYAEYRRLQRAIKGGATSLEDLHCKVSHSVTVEEELTPEQKELREKFKQLTDQHENPEFAFKKMQQYVKMVVNHTQPSVILCGAPGIGKTYRVMQQLRAMHKTMSAENTIKGKCSPRQLYLTLYNNKGRNDIVLIDDADGLVGPKAPEDCINILKAACDSTSDDEGRLVSYRVSGELKDDEGDIVPKSMYFNGGVIVITNYGVGQLDSALRNRSFTQEMSFTPEEILGIIKDLMPKIESQHLSMESKNKAYDFLMDMAKAKLPMELSIRSFVTCARCFNDADDLNNPDDVKVAESMIMDQMKNMSMTSKTSKHF